MVCVLLFYSDNSSSNPAEVNSLYFVKLFEKNQNIKIGIVRSICIQVLEAFDEIKNLIDPLECDFDFHLSSLTFDQFEQFVFRSKFVLLDLRLGEIATLKKR